MTLAAKLARIIAGLCQTLVTRSDTDRGLQPVGSLIWVRLYEAATQLHSLCARWRDGRLTASRKRPPNAQSPERERERARASTKPHSVLPRGFGWLVTLVPEAAVYGSQLQHLLTTDPQVATLLAEAPQAGRILRPICRMLGVQPIPQMLSRPASKPRTPDPETAPPETPPGDSPQAAMTAREKQRWMAENITPGLRRPLPKDPEDLRRLRPFTMWWPNT